MKTIELVQSVMFDIYDMIDSGDVDDVTITGFDEFETLIDFLREQVTKLEQIETKLEEANHA